jgi:hypothetical protein
VVRTWCPRVKGAAAPGLLPVSSSNQQLEQQPKAPANLHMQGAAPSGSQLDQRHVRIPTLGRYSKCSAGV